MPSHLANLHTGPSSQQLGNFWKKAPYVRYASSTSHDLPSANACFLATLRKSSSSLVRVDVRDRNASCLPLPHEDERYGPWFILQTAANCTTNFQRSVFLAAVLIAFHVSWQNPQCTHHSKPRNCRKCSRHDPTEHRSTVLETSNRPD